MYLTHFIIVVSIFFYLLIADLTCQRCNNVKTVNCQFAIKHSSLDTHGPRTRKLFMNMIYFRHRFMGIYYVQSCEFVSCWSKVHLYLKLFDYLHEVQKYIQTKSTYKNINISLEHIVLYEKAVHFKVVFCTKVRLYFFLFRMVLAQDMNELEKLKGAFCTAVGPNGLNKKKVNGNNAGI